jgi:hypothetical protein
VSDPQTPGQPATSTTTEQQKQSDDDLVSHYKKVLRPLETLVQMVNGKGNDKFAVTLTIKGIIISGSLVSLLEFHEDTSNKILQSTRRISGQESFEEMKLIMDAAKKTYQPKDLQNWDVYNSYVCIKNPVFCFLSGYDNTKSLFT